MANFIDMQGLKFNRLTVLELAKSRIRGNKPVTFWVCKCDCGKIVEVAGARLRTTNRPTRSCGCYAKEVLILNGKKVGNLPKKGKHKLSRTKIHDTWLNIKSRCHRKTATGYHIYGGRGITVCDEWMNSFQTFLKDMGMPPSNKHTIERIDVNKGYSPSNCKWATMKEQSVNKRNNHFITYNGETKTISEWGIVYGIPYNTIIERLNRGWSITKAFTTRPNGGCTHLIYKGQKKTLTEWSEIYNIKMATLYYRINKGWSTEDILTYQLRKTHVRTLAEFQSPVSIEV